MSIFLKTKNFEPAENRLRNKSGITDFTIYLVLVLIVLSVENFSSALKAGIILSYGIIVIPVLVSILGGSPGHLMNNLRVRKKSNPGENISIGSSFLRLGLEVIFKLVGLKSVYEKNNPSVVVELKEELTEEEALVAKKRSSRINFAITAIIYILWVIWVQNYWFLFGLIVIYDIYITKKVNWSFWKKREGNNSVFVEWIDALIFAVIAVTLINIFLFQNYKIPTGSMEKSLLIGDHLYVSKVAFGPRIPNTPLAFPFSQHTMPLTQKTKSYVEWIKLPYKRLAGFGKIKRDDPVVFNFPAGDTVVVQDQARSYYSIVRDSAQMLREIDTYYKRPLKTSDEYYSIARNRIWKRFDVVVRPIDKRDNYIKRCVAIPGDTLQIIDAQVYVNGKPQKSIPGVQLFYLILVKPNSQITERVLDRLDIYEYQRFPGTPHLRADLTEDALKKIKAFTQVHEVRRDTDIGDNWDLNYFPGDSAFRWTLDNFGPLYIPAKGATMDINLQTLPLYERVIGYYEKNDLKVSDGKIYINGEEASTYTFKMDYYWMMGDNRHLSLDSRFWGFVPEDHIIGKPKFIWLSVNKNKSFLNKIRWNRMFMGIK
jgi:signal peptidase I